MTTTKAQVKTMMMIKLVLAFWLVTAKQNEILAWPKFASADQHHSIDTKETIRLDVDYDHQFYGSSISRHQLASRGEQQGQDQDNIFPAARNNDQEFYRVEPEENNVGQQLTDEEEEEDDRQVISTKDVAVGDRSRRKAQEESNRLRPQSPLNGLWVPHSPQTRTTATKDQALASTEGLEDHVHRHHHSSEPVNAVESIRGASGNERHSLQAAADRNPLIERTPQRRQQQSPRSSPSNPSEDDYIAEEGVGHQRGASMGANRQSNHHHQRLIRGHGADSSLDRSRRNTRPHSNADDHEGNKRRDRRLRDKSGLCHWNCAAAESSKTNSRPKSLVDNNNNGSELVRGKKGDPKSNSATSAITNATAASICGSDGHFYNSLCELRQTSCKLNVRLTKRPKAFCFNSSSSHSIQHHSRQKRRHLTGENERVRIVELKQRCNRQAYEEMKLLLMREFNHDLDLMFRYFDSNGDDYIEAHELWPKRELESNQLVYAQVWNEHSNECSYDHHNEWNESSIESMEVAQNNHHRKCWFSLDFAFEPKFASNPCSLSHLMLFDLTHPNNKFSKDLFKLAFSNTNKISSIVDPEIIDNGDAKNNGGNISKNLAINRTTHLQIGLGDSIELNCLLNASGLLSDSSIIGANLFDNDDNNTDGDGDDEDYLTDSTSNKNRPLIGCFWTRNDVNLATIQDPHIFIEKQSVQLGNGKSVSESVLHLRDAQLYLSGHFGCACHSKRRHNIERTFYRHSYSVKVSAEPRVEVRPQFQWSLPSSRISFECHYDYIDTSISNEDDYDSPRKQRVEYYAQDQEQELEERGQFGLKVKWLKDDRELIVDNKRYYALNEVLNNSTEFKASDGGSSGGDFDDRSFETPSAPIETISIQNAASSKWLQDREPLRLSQSSLRASITMAASRLTLENLTLSDTGRHACRVEVPNKLMGRSSNFSILERASNTNISPSIFGQSNGTLLVQDRPKADQPEAAGQVDDGEGVVANGMFGTYLWMFHDNGISIYRLQNDDGQEMELVKEINGHSPVNAEVDGNWNQLTLCGGLNPEQVVICEWSDNALHIDVDHYGSAKQYNDGNGSNNNNNNNSKRSAPKRKYIYVGQPNLNRVIVMDGLKFEIVAVINTEPQPRKLFLYKPSKIHLSKWVRRRLSPIANARWLSAIGTHAHSLKSTPESKLYSSLTDHLGHAKIGSPPRHHREVSASAQGSNNGRRFAGPTATNQMPSPLVQHDIWLLCYGQPLVVDPSGEEHLEEAGRFYSAFGDNLQSSSDINTNSTTIDHNKQSTAASKSNVNIVQPFTPRLSAGPPLAWSIWPNNKEAKLRNRKSVHIIQSTFFPQSLSPRNSNLHAHQQDAENEANEEGNGFGGGSHRNGAETNGSAVAEFKRSTVLTTHHVFAGMPTTSKAPMYLTRPRFDLIQDLSIPLKPYSLEMNPKHKIHYAYVTHYNDRRLFRVSMDEYRYDREIDLQNCDPINSIITAQGLLVVQCRAPITHNLIGQLVLGQLTSAQIEFNAQVRAQQAYLSPDNRYLVSILTNSSIQALDSETTATTTQPLSENDIDSSSGQSSSYKATNKTLNGNQRKNVFEKRRQSIIYVQMVSVSGLKLQYEIKTTLEISQCSFVWKNGYYVAIFVSTNRRDEQSEILSLRLADSRLQLMVRVPGIISVSRHKDQLIVSPELRLAALSTNKGTYVVDLEDNRVSQSLRQHQYPPTILWV